MLIYKIFRPSEWTSFNKNTSTHGAPIDLSDGYIHFSTAQTVQQTAQKHFQGEDHLTLAAVESTTLHDLKWEPSRGGILFPHLYRVLHLHDLTWHCPLPLKGDTHHFPQLD